jgi:diguanylate cyclase (GGDEF)-like protein
VSAAVATIVLTNFATVEMVRSRADASADLYPMIWPIALTSAVAVILVMSFLHKSLADVVKELEAREKAAQHLAVHDTLTGLPNRALLNDRLNQALRRLKRDDERVALLMLDLDRFKQVNDTLGHSAGDMLVAQVAERLKALLRDSDTVARIGGDEFAIIQNKPKGAADVRRLCRRIVEAVAEPFEVGGREARVGVSVGAVLANPATANGSELLRKADITMYRAKAAGRNGYQLFTDDMDLEVQRRNRVEIALRRALEADRGVKLHYQVQVNARGEIVGVEGLLRWADAELGDLSPSEVIPIAEESGLIDNLGELTFRRACEAARRWPSISVALNLSPAQFSDPDMPSKLWRIAQEEGVACRQIELEITEGVYIHHADRCEEAIRQLRTAGFRIALDDFGTGYSSLSYLRRFPVDKIKLDRSFMNSGHEDQRAAILAAAVTLGHAMEIEVVAEGVADAEQERIALAAGCDGLQGYRFGMPMPADEMDAFLTERSTCVPMSGARMPAAKKAALVTA